MRSLPQRRLYDDVEASVVGFGGSSIAGDHGGYHFGALSETDAIETLQHAYEQGITLFDTAPCYGLGASERRIGAALAGDSAVRRHLRLVSKGGVTWQEKGELYVDNSAENLRRMLAQSLSDLRVDRIDLYFIHWPDPKVPIEDTMETLLRAKDEGLIAAIGASNMGSELLERARRVGPVAALQMELNALNVNNAEQLFELVRASNMSFLAYGTLAKGMLAGGVKGDTQYRESDARRALPFVATQAKTLKPEIEAFEAIATELSVPPATLAAAWVLSKPEVSTTLCGCKSPSQVDQAVAAGHLCLGRDHIARIDAIAAAATPRFLAAMAS